MPHRYGLTDESMDCCLLLIGILARGATLDQRALLELCQAWNIPPSSTDQMVHDLALYAVGRYVVGEDETCTPSNAG